MHPPRPGSILVGDESETWETISPQLDSFEAGADGLALKKQIAAGAGIPIHYLAEPESSTRTTAEAAGTPAFKNFADYRESFFNILRDVIEISCAIRRQVDENILPQPEIDIHAGDISERDNPNLSIAFARAVQAAGDLYDRKMIDTREMLRVSYGFGGLVYDETENQAEGLRRPVRSGALAKHPGGASDTAKRPRGTAPHRRHEPPVPPPKTDPETGEVIEPPSD